MLVMVGILLALQVNNWSEEQKLRKREQKLLKEMLVDLEDQQDDLRFNAQHHQEGESSCQIIREALLNDAPYHDSLQNHFKRTYNFTVLNDRKNAYNLLLSEGIELIRNDSLRSYISKYYEQGVPFQLQIQEVTVELTNASSQRHLALFKNMNWNTPLEPWDYEALKKDKEYISWLSFMGSNKHFELTAFQNLLKNNKKLVADINLELKNNF